MAHFVRAQDQGLGLFIHEVNDFSCRLTHVLCRAWDLLTPNHQPLHLGTRLVGQVVNEAADQAVIVLHRALCGDVDLSLCCVKGTVFVFEPVLQRGIEALRDVNDGFLGAVEGLVFRCRRHFLQAFHPVGLILQGLGPGVAQLDKAHFSAARGFGHGRRNANSAFLQRGLRGQRGFLEHRSPSFERVSQLLDPVGDVRDVARELVAVGGQLFDGFARSLRGLIAHDGSGFLGRVHEVRDLLLELFGNGGAVAVDRCLQVGQVRRLFRDGFVQLFSMSRQVLSGLTQGVGLLFQAVLHLVRDAVGFVRDRLEQVDLPRQLAGHGLHVGKRSICRDA